ncbi:MAG: YceH family protein [Lysobacterales bacterium]
MTVLTPIQVRVLGCLIEKKETTPEQYPLTVNALRTACNQKTARHPVTAYTEGEVGRTVRELLALGYAGEAWGARTARYEHLAGKVLELQGKGLALLCPMMLRGPQTPGELKTNAQRLYEFPDLDDVNYALQRLAEHEPPLVMALPRMPGQKEVRYVHLLGGEPDPAELEALAARSAETDNPGAGLAARVDALESAVEALREEVAELRSRLGETAD